MEHLPYVPILKGKQGEFRALAELTAPDRARVRPMIDVPPLPSDRAPADHYRGQATRLRDAWPAGVPIFIDSRLVQRGMRIGGEHPAAQLFRATATYGIHAIPVTGLRREAHYQGAVRDAAGDAGACIRLEDTDLGIRLHAEMDAVLERLALEPERVDVVLDYRDAVRNAPSSLAIGAAAVIDALPHRARWRSLTLASGAFPQTLGPMRPGEPHRLPRTERDFWRDVRARLGAAGRRPAFGDYAIAHPDLPRVEGRQINVPVALRYTTEREYVVMKWGTLREVGGAGFREICARLVRMPEYSGSAFSWGDRYIDESARGITGGGNASVWRAVGTSHHLTATVLQLRDWMDSASPRAA